MSSGVTLTAATRSNLLSLQGTADLVATTQNRLSTGKKVNSALDNPANFFTSQALNSRSADLSGLLDGISNGIQTIQAANRGLTNLTKLTDQLKATAQQALASSNAFTAKNKVTSVAAGTVTGANILGTTAAGTAAVAGTTTGTVTGLTSGTLLSAGSPGFAQNDTIVIGSTTITIGAAGSTASATNIPVDTGTVGGLLSAIQTAIGGAGTASLNGSGAVVLTGTNAANLVVGGNSAKLGITAGTFNFTPAGAGTTALTGSLDVTVGTGTDAQTASVTFGTGANQVDTLDKLNAILNEKGAQANVSAAGKLEITTTNEAGTKALSVKGTAATTLFGAANGTAVTNGTGLSLGGDGLVNRNKLVTDFNSLLVQIDQQAKDASFNGINLLNGDNLKINFNEKTTSSLNVRGVAVTSAGLGITDIAPTDFQDSNAISAVMAKVSTATSSLKNLAATYGSNLSVVQNRQDFTKNMINILDTGSANLTNADLNEEAANSQALSTRQSLGISALSLANQANQGILQLLR